MERLCVAIHKEDRRKALLWFVYAPIITVRRLRGR